MGLNGDGSFYENRTTNLEGRVNIHDNIKNLIKVEPVRMRALGVKEGNEDYIIVFDNKKKIHVVDLATNQYFGDFTEKFYNIFDFVPVDALSARVNNHPSPYHDNVLALKRDDGYWSLYWWEDVNDASIRKEIAKPIPTLERFNMEGLFDDKRLGNVISLGIANLYGEQFDSLYAIRTPPLEGRIDDLQTARDIIDFNQGEYIIKRWGLPIPVFVEPSASRELVAKAIKKLELRYGCLMLQ